MTRRFLASAILILISTLGVSAQTNNRSSVKDPEAKSPKRFPADEQRESTLPAEMRIKMAIARAEIEHKKLIDDVDKLGDLATEIARVYSESKHLSPDQFKKLSTIEKLAKKVLSHAGGDEIEDKSGALAQLPLAEAIEKLNTAAENIRKDVKAETRFVVSATVIANSNDVINLARLIRRAKKAD